MYHVRWPAEGAGGGEGRAGCQRALARRRARARRRTAAAAAAALAPSCRCPALLPGLTAARTRPLPGCPQASLVLPSSVGPESRAAKVEAVLDETLLAPAGCVHRPAMPVPRRPGVLACLSTQSAHVPRWPLLSVQPTRPAACPALPARSATQIRSLSGGQTRRWALALSLLRDPLAIMAVRAALSMRLPSCTGVAMRSPCAGVPPPLPVQWCPHHPCPPPPPPAAPQDEPTSGLDATMALSVMRVLHLQARAGRMVALTIHQPRAAIVALFDDMLVLAGGSKGGRAGAGAPPRQCSPAGLSPACCPCGCLPCGGAGACGRAP